MTQWQWRPLGEVAETSLGKMLDKGQDRGRARVQYLRNVNVQWDRIDTSDLLTMELADEERDRFGVRAGDLLVCEGGEIGRAAIWPGRRDYIAYQKALHRVRPGVMLNNRFLLHYFSFAAQTGRLDSLSTGSTIRHLPQRQLRHLQVPMPSLDEQRQIVDILEDHLSRLDAAASSLNASARRLGALTKSILMQVIPDASCYPSRWTRCTVADAGSIELGRQRHPDWHTGDNMKPYLRVANVFEDRIDASDLKEMHWPEQVFEKFRLSPGDVLLNEGQSPEYLGRPAIYQGKPAEVAFTNTLIRFRAHPNVLPEFALLVFRRHMHAGRFLGESRITTNIAHLSAARLKSVEFPVPPVDEQRHIVDLAHQRLAAVEVLRGEVGNAVRRLSALRRALLAAAFTGRLSDRSLDFQHVEELT